MPSNEVQRGVFLDRRGIHPFFWLMIPFVLIFSGAGCKSTSQHLRDADEAALAIIREKQEQAVGRHEGFDIRPENILRRRLLLDQALPYSSEASLGTDRLHPVEHWPELYDKTRSRPPDTSINIPIDKPLKLTLIQALQVGAMNSSAYQSKKEDVFRAALDLDLRRNDFKYIMEAKGDLSYTNDGSGSLTPKGTVRGIEIGGSLDVKKDLIHGAGIAASLVLDLAKLLSHGMTSSLGISADTSISIPLLRGSGRHIVAEPLTQAERNVIYAIYEFERFKKVFAVEIAGSYLSVLEQQERVGNATKNYNNLRESTKRLRMLANAGRSTEIEVDQAVQRELAARNRLVRERELYKGLLDAFKRDLGLPPDAAVELDRSEIEGLISKILQEQGLREDPEFIYKAEGKPGPLEMDATKAIEIALENRLDLRIIEGKVLDAQRKVVVRADALRPELTLFGKAETGEGRSLANAHMADADPGLDKGVYTGILSLDLALDRSGERNELRKALLDLEKAVRDLQDLEDDIKLAVRNRLRDMLEAREGLRIQYHALALAEKRVKSTDLFFRAGRAQVRDILDAEEALINARNALMEAAVNYRVAELEFQREIGTLKIDERGIMEDFVLIGKEDAKGDQ
ncbi:MAG: TolC family protein [Deltaproteobacteria bacterium]|nr:TolC family protein [Deltaproteobacteria bacterium]MBW2303309.1 TolC family protein [Deltaproteobacteria bacterium]